MNFLEKDGNKIAVALTTASAVAAGFSVYTMTTSQEGADLVASAIQILDPTSTNQEVETKHYIDQTDQKLPRVITGMAFDEDVREQSDFEVVNESSSMEFETVATVETPVETVEAPVQAPAEPIQVADENQIVTNYVEPVVNAPAPAPVEVPVQQTVQPEAPAQPEVPAQPETTEVLLDENQQQPIVPEENLTVDDHAVVDAPFSELPSDSQAPIAQEVPSTPEQPAPEAPAEPVVPEVPMAPTPEQPGPGVPSANPYQELNDRIAQEAMKLVGVTDGLQCTEVVQMAMSNAGVQDAQCLWPNQYESAFGFATDNPQAGNLIYYNQGGNGKDHIAIYIGNGQAVHGNYTIDGVAQTVIASDKILGCEDYTYIQVDR